jgi:hypothetical protein
MRAVWFLVVAACAAGRPVLVVPGGPRGDYAPTIPDEGTWQALAARPGSEHVAHTEVVKFLIDSTTGAIYFTQSERWPIHYYFAERFLFDIPSEGTFNQIEYHRADRRFVLGTLARYVDAGVWTFELYAGDELDLDATARAFAQVKAKVFFGAEMKYRPVPVAHERAVERARELMPVVTTDEVFGAVTYQPLELGEAYGYVRVVPAGTKMDAEALRPYDLVVLGDLPEDIPVVAGVVTDQLQAPLGHINVLCHNRKTPNMALRGASTDERVLALKDKLARLVVDGQTWRLEPATQADAEKSWAIKRPKKAFSPPRDDRDVGLPLLASIQRDQTALFGAKTAQLAFVAGMSPKIETPRAFGLPMYAYVRFLRENGLDRRIVQMLSDPAFRGDPDVRRRALDELRAAMLAAPVPAELVARLRARMKEVLPRGRVRLRSSTNAEDLPGFNGAGLYRSTRVDPDREDDVIRGLREVWASVWLWAAFEEREFYRIDERTVGMAILVQQSIDDDVANGVAITRNPYNQGQPGFFINAQLSASGGSVTGARGDEVPEQILYYNFKDGRGWERVSRSSRAGGGDVLTAAEIERLHGYLATIHEGFTGDSPDDFMNGRAVDVEFLIAGTPRRVVIVQARPYTVVWAGDRRYPDLD